MKPNKMKKFLLTLSLSLTVGLTFAQTETTNASVVAKVDSLQQQLNVFQTKEEKRSQAEYDDKIWVRKKYFTIGYVSQKLTNKDLGYDRKSQFGASLTYGRTYYLHKSAIAHILKIGLDWTRLSANFVKYKTDDLTEVSTLESDYGDYDDDNASGKDNVYQLDLGMGIGPSLNFAPFYSVGHGLQHLKLHTYFHVTPSYSLLIENTDGDTECHHGYTTFYNFGIDVAYKAISLGYEYRWGNSKFNSLSLAYDEEEGEGIKTGKQKFKFGTSTVYLRFNF